MVKKGKWSVPGSFSKRLLAIAPTEMHVARRIQREVRQHVSHLNRPMFFFVIWNPSTLKLYGSSPLPDLLVLRHTTPISAIVTHSPEDQPGHTRHLLLIFYLRP